MVIEYHCLRDFKMRFKDSEIYSRSIMVPIKQQWKKLINTKHGIKLDTYMHRIPVKLSCFCTGILSIILISYLNTSFNDSCKTCILIPSKQIFFLTLWTTTTENGRHTQTVCRHIADELFECVWPCCGVGA